MKQEASHGTMSCTTQSIHAAGDAAAAHDVAS